MFTFHRARFLINFIALFCLILTLSISSTGSADETQSNLDESLIYLPVVLHHQAISGDAVALDPSFGSDGWVTTQIARNFDSGSDIVLQPDGKILVAGYYGGGYTDFLVNRFYPDGSLDTSFGGSGRVGISFGGLGAYGHAVALQPDGKIVVAGSLKRFDVLFPQFDIALARLNLDGSLDTSFGGEGMLLVDFNGGDDFGYAVALQPDGKIIVSGASCNETGTGFALARLNPDGSLDTSFDGDGKLITDFAGGAYDIILQTDGKIVVVGQAMTSTSSDFALARYHPDGKLDKSFGINGLVTTNIVGDDTGVSAVLQPDGKLIVAGYSNNEETKCIDFAVARYHSNGSLDTSFSDDGWVTTYFGDSDVSHIYQEGRDVTLQPDGKIVVVGIVGDTEGQTFSGIALARYNPDGGLDPSFDSDGRLTTNFEGKSISLNSIALQADGKILVAGNSYTQMEGTDLAVLRYLSDGSLDTSLDTDGLVTINNGGEDSANSAVLQSDGKILVAGTTSDGSINYLKIYDSDLALARYHPDGSLDTSFSEDGWVTVTYSTSVEGNSVALQTDGKIVMAGMVFYDYSIEPDFTIARFTTQGELDTSFSSDGKLTTDFSGYRDSGQAVVIQSDGKIVVAGVAHNGVHADFALVRYKPNGNLDTSFDGDGKLTTDFSHGDDSGNAVALQPDGKIVVAGSAYNGENGDFALARYHPDGSLDMSFDGDGKLTTDFSGNYDVGQAVLLQPDGKIVVAGWVYNGVNHDFALARYNPDGSLDTNFDGDGKLTTDFSGDDDFGYAVALQSDGKIVVAGSVYNGSHTNFALARYHPDGSLDMIFDGDGKLTTDFFGYGGDCHALIIQPDNKIVVAGAIINGTDSDFGLARYK